jgi:tetratricopeptide (TPR) repeat protein
MQESLELAQRIGDRDTVVRVLGTIAFNEADAGNRSAAEAHIAQLLGLLDELTEMWQRGETLEEAGNVLALLGDTERGIHLLQQSLHLRRHTGDDLLVAGCLDNLGYWLLSTDRIDEARASIEEALEIFSRLGIRTRIGGCLGNLGLAAQLQRRHAEAVSLLTRSAVACYEHGDRLDLMESWLVLAAAYAASERHAEAARLAGAARALYEETKLLPAAFVQAEADRQLAVSRTALGDAMYNALWQEGRDMPDHAALQLAERITTVASFPAETRQSADESGPRSSAPGVYNQEYDTDD